VPVPTPAIESVTVHVTPVTVGEFPPFATFIVGLWVVAKVPAGVDHEYETKLPVPPVAEHRNWTVSPAYAVLGAAVAVTTIGMAPLIVRLPVEEACVPLLSVTVHVSPEVIAVGEGFEAVIAGFWALLNVPVLLDHEYDVNVPLPPVAVHENCTAPPFATGFGVARTVTTGGGGRTVSVNEALPVLPFESVTEQDTERVMRPGPAFERFIEKL